MAFKCITVRREDYGDRWPLTVDEALLCHDPKTRAVRVTVGGRNYGLTGHTRALFGDLDPEPIHAHNPHIPPIPDEDDEAVGHTVRKDLGVLTRDARKII